jgi:MSHA biogenesis protein MshM
MYLEHFGLNESPFRITPHTDFFYAGANRGAMLDALLYAITHDEGIVKVSGEVGTGKTMMCRVLMERLPAHVETIYLSNPSLSRDEILYSIADELRLDTANERGARVLKRIQDALIERFAKGKRVVVLIDEAHAMPRETLEEIRLLSNLEANRQKLLQLVLFGQPELDELLNTTEMRQLKERITHGFRLDPLDRGDIKSYIDYRMRAAGYRGPNPFSDAAVRIIDAASKGLTRRINILADKSLLAAFASNSHQIGEREARRAVSDSDFYTPRRRRVGIVRTGAVALVGLAIGYGISVILSDKTPVAPPTTGIGPSGLVTTPDARPESSRVAGDAPASPMPSTAVTPAVVEEATEKAKPAAPSPSGAPSRSAQTSAGGSITSPAAKTSSVPPSPEGASTFAEANPNLGKRAAAKFAATQEWLKRAPGKNYAIQLVTVPETEPARLESFIGRAERRLPDAELYVYGVKINGLQHYRVAYGNYASVEQVKSAIEELPPDIKAPGPYFRSFERMRSQNSQ